MNFAIGNDAPAYVGITARQSLERYLSRDVTIVLGSEDRAGQIPGWFRNPGPAQTSSSESPFPFPPPSRRPNTPPNSVAPAPAAVSANPLTRPTRGSAERFQDSW
jgi:hypothetical protein